MCFSLSNRVDGRRTESAAFGAATGTTRENAIRMQQLEKIISKLIFLLQCHVFAIRGTNDFAPHWSHFIYTILLKNSRIQKLRRIRRALSYPHLVQVSMVAQSDIKRSVCTREG